MKVCSDLQSRIKFLKADFAAFRRRCRPHAKVPENLRHAVVAALDAGVEPTLIKSALGITSGQVAIWRRRMLPQDDCRPRILDVVPLAPGIAGAPAGLRVSFEAGRLLLELSF